MVMPRKTTGSNGRWQLLLMDTWEHSMNCCGSKEAFGNLYGFSDIVERGDARKFHVSSSDSVVSFSDWCTLEQYIILKIIYLYTILTNSLFIKYCSNKNAYFSFAT